MKTRMILIAGIVFFAATGFLQERSIEKGRSLDLKLAYQSCETTHEIPEYLSLFMKNTSSLPLKLTQGLIVLEVRSICGGVIARLPLTDEMMEDLSDLEKGGAIFLKPNQDLNLKIPVREMLEGGAGEDALNLENKTYTLNAFITEEKDLKKLHKAEKIRSNYLELELGKEDEDLSYRPLK